MRVRLRLVVGPVATRAPQYCRGKQDRNGQHLRGQFGFLREIPLEQKLSDWRCDTHQVSTFDHCRSRRREAYQTRRDNPVCLPQASQSLPRILYMTPKSILHAKIIELEGCKIGLAPHGVLADPISSFLKSISDGVKPALVGIRTRG